MMNTMISAQSKCHVGPPILLDLRSFAHQLNIGSHLRVDTRREIHVLATARRSGEGCGWARRHVRAGQPRNINRSDNDDLSVFVDRMRNVERS